MSFYNRKDEMLMLNEKTRDFILTVEPPYHRHHFTSPRLGAFNDSKM